MHLNNILFEDLYGKSLVEMYKLYLKYLQGTSKGKVVTLTRKKFLVWMSRTYNIRNPQVTPVWWTVIIDHLLKYAVTVIKGRSEWSKRRLKIVVRTEDLPKIAEELK